MKPDEGLSKKPFKILTLNVFTQPKAVFPVTAGKNAPFPKNSIKISLQYC